MLSPSANKRWSSAMPILICSMQWYFYDQVQAVAGAGIQVPGAIYFFYAGVNVLVAHAIGFLQLCFIKALPVVFIRVYQVAIIPAQLYAHLFGFSIFNGVAHQLLSNAVELGFKRLIKRGGQLVVEVGHF